MDDSYPLAGIISIILLIIIKALISNAKAAIGNINEATVRKKAEENQDKDSLLLVELSEKPESYIFAIDIVITSISVLCGYIYYAMIYQKVNDTIYYIGIHNDVFCVIIHIIFVILLVIIIALFGSLIPKKLAFIDSEKKAYATIGLMMFVMRLFRPITFLLQHLINLNIRLFGIDPAELNENVTEEEIISMVNEGHEQGVLEANEVEMISNIMEFDDKEVRDIMTHRKSIVALDGNMKIDDGLKFMVEENYSRYPVYEEEIDNVIGILHIKDVARCYLDGDNPNKCLSELARKPYFVPETQNIDVLLNDMQSNKTHMAIAVDEYGQTSGIVAFEDILEEIVGNILDEYDEEEKAIIKQPNGHYIMRGLTELDDINKTLGIDIESEEYDTLNGLLISLIQRIPKDGEKMTVVYAGYMFEILDVRNKMIKLVRVKKNTISKK